MLETLDYKIPMTTKAPLPVISVRGAGRGVGRSGHYFLAQVAAAGRQKIEIQPSHRPRSQKSISWQPGIGVTNEHSHYSQCLSRTVCMLHAPLQLEMCVMDAAVG